MLGKNIPNSAHAQKSTYFNMRYPGTWAGTLQKKTSPIAILTLNGLA